MSRKRCEMTTGGKRCPRYAMTAISKFCEQCAAPRKTIGQQMQDEADDKARAREDAKRELLAILEAVHGCAVRDGRNQDVEWMRRAIEIARTL